MFWWNQDGRNWRSTIINVVNSFDTIFPFLEKRNKVIGPYTIVLNQITLFSRNRHWLVPANLRRWLRPPYLLRVVSFTDFLQLVLVNKLKQTCLLHQLVTSLLRPGLLQRVIVRLVATCSSNLWMTSFYNQLETSLFTSCNRLVVNKLLQAIRTHQDRNYSVN